MSKNARRVCPFFTSGVAGAAAWLLLAGSAEAGLMTDAEYNKDEGAAHKEFGKRFEKTVLSFFAGSKWLGSGVLLDSPNGNKRCVLFTAHQYDAALNEYPDITTWSFRLGANCYADSVLTFPVENTILHPSRQNGSGTDLVIAVLTHDVADGVGAIVSSSQPVLEEICVMAGFGYTATPSKGLLSNTGDLRAGYAPVTRSGNDIRTSFNTSRTIDLMMGATPGDSGGALFVNNNDFNSPILYATISEATVPNISSLTYSVPLNQPQNYSFIQDTVSSVSSALPQPYQPTNGPRLGIRSIAGGAVHLEINRPLEETRDGRLVGSWVLETSGDCQTWEKIDTAEFAASASSPDIFECQVPQSTSAGFFRLKYAPTPAAP